MRVRVIVEFEVHPDLASSDLQGLREAICDCLEDERIGAAVYGSVDKDEMHVAPKES